MLERLAPRRASVGAWGADGLLYVTGHDRPELYALRVADAGGTLGLVATIATPTDGQAFGWSAARSRTMWSIDRGASMLVESVVPAVPGSR